MQKEVDSLGLEVLKISLTSQDNFSSVQNNLKFEKKRSFSEKRVKDEGFDPTV